MALILPAVLLLIIFIFVGVIGTDGLWHSIITFFNVLTAAVLATNYYEPVSLWLDTKMPTFSYLIDFMVLWVLFAVIVAVLRQLTQFASRVRVWFPKLVDMAGGFLVSALTGWIVVSFALMSLHTAPLPPHGFGGSFQEKPDTRMFFGLGPDRKWLAMMHKMSRTNFGKSAPAEQPEKYVFDPDGSFILTYYGRRAAFETTSEMRVHRTWGTGIIEDKRLIVAE